MEFLKPKTVAGAVAPLLKVLHNLEGVVDASANVVADNEGKIQRLVAESKAAGEERLTAKAIINALNGIINPGADPVPVQ